MDDDDEDQQLPQDNQPPVQPELTLIESIVSNRLIPLQRFFDNGTDLNQRLTHTFTTRPTVLETVTVEVSGPPIFLAATMGCHFITMALIKHGVDLDAVGSIKEEGNKQEVLYSRGVTEGTALFVSVIRSHWDCSLALLDGGARYDIEGRIPVLKGYRVDGQAFGTAFELAPPSIKERLGKWIKDNMTAVQWNGVFNTYDSKKKGVLSTFEAKKLLEDNSIPFTDADLTAYKSGKKFTFQEFCKFWLAHGCPHSAIVEAAEHGSEAPQPITREGSMGRLKSSAGSPTIDANPKGMGQRRGSGSPTAVRKASVTNSPTVQRKSLTGIPRQNSLPKQNSLSSLGRQGSAGSASSPLVAKRASPITAPGSPKLSSLQKGVSESRLPTRKSGGSGSDSPTVARKSGTDSPLAARKASGASPIASRRIAESSSSAATRKSSTPGSPAAASKSPVSPLVARRASTPKGPASPPQTVAPKTSSPRRVSSPLLVRKTAAAGDTAQTSSPKISSGIPRRPSSPKPNLRKEAAAPIHHPATVVTPVPAQ